MISLSVISTEHRGIWRLTTALDSMNKSMQENGSYAAIPVVILILDYLSDYIDKMHHPKGPHHLSALRALALSVTNSNTKSQKAFHDKLISFIGTLRTHMQFEETTVMPLARKVLTKEDWQEIDAAFLNNDDPLFGTNARAEFAALRAQITLFAPEPVGLGGSFTTEMLSHISKKTVAPANTPAPAALDISGLTSHYGRIQALHGINMQVEEGQLVALVGANGAGKTTLLRAISGVQAVSGGIICLHGANITKMNPDKRVRAGICQVPEGRQVFGPMSIEDNLRLGAFTRPKADLDEDIEKMYGLFPILKEKRHLPAGTLSGGQQQMLAMARALMGRPKLLLLDEPGMGLSPLLVQEIFRIISNLKKQGMTILLVEQNAHAALSIADKGYVIETGTITLSGTGQELLNNERVRHAYLGM